MKLRSFLICMALLLPMPATAKPTAARTEEGRVAKVRAAIAEIQKECGIPKTAGQFRYDGKGIALLYDEMIEREKLDCAHSRAVLRGVGFDSYDTSATYSGPDRFIIKGPPKRLDGVAAEVTAAHWTITHRADAGDGIGFLEIQTPPKATRREVRAFLDRFIGGGDLSDVAVGLAPMTRAGHDLPATSTVFRSHARKMYEDLLMASCGTPAGFDREAILKPDRDAVRALEQRLSTTSAAPHLAIAREDVAYKFTKETHCWADYDDPAFAKIHTDMIHRSVSIYSAGVAKLASALDPLPAAAAPANAAEFRYNAWGLVEGTLPLCSWTTKGSNGEVLAAARKEIGSFEDRLKGSAYAIHFAVAREDAVYDRSRRVAECDGPGHDSVAKLSAQALATAKSQIARLEKLMVPAQ